MIKVSLTWGMPRYADSLHAWMLAGSVSGRKMTHEGRYEWHRDATLCVLGLELKLQWVHGRKRTFHPAARRRR